MENELLQIPATIESINSRVDGTWSIKVGTQELAEENARAIINLNRKLGWFIFKETPLLEADILNIPESTPEFKGDKTPSQRLRGTIYVWWQQTKPTKTFDEFYKQRMEQMIDWVKGKLENNGAEDEPKE